MNEFLSQFGIDWKLFISQLVNFFLLLIVLRLFVYKPVLSVMKKRRQKIEEGLMKAEEASVRLKEVDQIAKNKIKETEKECVSLLGKTEIKKKELEAEIFAKAKKKEEELLKKAEAMAEARRKETYQELQKEAAELIKSAISKTVDLKPEQIDQALIKKAAAFLRDNEI